MINQINAPISIRLAAITVCLASLGLQSAVFAGDLTLADLISDPQATFRSHNGQLEFGDFSFEPTRGEAGLPSADAVRIIADALAPGGFRIEGPYQALNGVDIRGTLQYSASSVNDNAFASAYISLGTPTVFGFNGSRSQLNENASFVQVQELIRPKKNESGPLSLGEEERILEVFLGADGQAINFASGSLDPDIFGSSVIVSHDIFLNSLDSDTTNSISILSSYSTGFALVPEPLTWLLLLGAAPLLLKRRRSNQI